MARMLKRASEAEQNDSQQPLLIRAEVIWIVLTTSAVALRLLARRVSGAGLWYDDYAILVAMLFAWALVILVFIALRFGFGRHASNAPSDAEQKWCLLLYIHQNFYVAALATVKASILLFYIRIFGRNVPFRRAVYGLGAVVFLWWIICQFLAIFECVPIHSQWTPASGDVHRPRCIDVRAYFMGQASVNMITDVLLMVMPIPMIWQLKLPTASRVGLVAIFAVGSFVTVASIYRLILLLHIDGSDLTWGYVKAIIWSTMEPNLAVFNACLPMLRPLLKPVATRLNTRLSRSNNKHTPSDDAKIPAAAKRPNGDSFGSDDRRHLAPFQRDLWRSNHRGNEREMRPSGGNPRTTRTVAAERDDADALSIGEAGGLAKNQIHVTETLMLDAETDHIWCT